MRLCMFEYHSSAKIGLKAGNFIIDLVALMTEQPVLRERLFKDQSSYINLDLLLRAGAEPWHFLLENFDRFTKGHMETLPESVCIPISTIRLLPPLRSPGKIIGVGLNYLDHCREQNIPAPEQPIIFSKYVTSIIGHQGFIQLPGCAPEMVDYEAELAVVIGQKAKNISADKAHTIIAGYLIANDITARDLQNKERQWVRAKSFDTFCPLSPFIITPDEIADANQLGIKCWVNDDLVQDSNTSEMIFKIPELIAFISQSVTLMPGDVIITGTPHGVGVYRNPQRFLRHGDQIKIEIEHLGELVNFVE